MDATTEPMDITTTPATPPTTTPTPSVPKERKTNAWIEHVKKYRLDNATTIKDQKLSCGQISRLAKGTYKAKAKCVTCGK